MPSIRGTIAAEPRNNKAEKEALTQSPRDIVTKCLLRAFWVDSMLRLILSGSYGIFVGLVQKCFGDPTSRSRLYSNNRWPPWRYHLKLTGRRDRIMIVQKSVLWTLPSRRATFSKTSRFSCREILTMPPAYPDFSGKWLRGLEYISFLCPCEFFQFLTRLSFSVSLFPNNQLKPVTPPTSH
jgi:hypothetical protein